MVDLPQAASAISFEVSGLPGAVVQRWWFYGIRFRRSGEPQPGWCDGGQIEAGAHTFGPIIDVGQVVDENGRCVHPRRDREDVADRVSGTLGWTQRAQPAKPEMMSKTLDFDIVPSCVGPRYLGTYHPDSLAPRHRHHRQRAGDISQSRNRFRLFSGGFQTLHVPPLLDECSNTSTPGTPGKAVSRVLPRRGSHAAIRQGGGGTCFG